MAGFDQKQLQRASQTEAGRRSLAFFEPRRVEIAQACSDALNIPLKEFDFAGDTVVFHFLTTAIAVGEWVASTGQEFADRRHEETYGHADEYPWLKAVSGAIARLVLHPLSMDVSTEDSVKFMNAFLTASTPRDMSQTKKIRRASMVQAVLMAYLLCRRGLTRTLEGYWEDGSPGSMSDWEFDPLADFLDENDSTQDDCHLFPRGAEKDAYVALYSEFDFLIERNEELPYPLPADPGSTDSNHAYQMAKRYLTQFSLYRKNARLKGANFSATRKTFDDAARALGTSKQFALFESMSDVGGDDGKTLPIHVPLDQNGVGKAAADLAKRSPDAPFNFRFLFLKLI